MPKLAVIAGTRPEAIKLAPVILQLKNEGYDPLVCNTGQHETLCGETLSYFGIEAHAKLDAMRPNQSLAHLQGRLLGELDQLVSNRELSGIVVQGDTMSAFCGALTAFYKRLPVFHVEAGLRSFNMAEPFPEEGLRQMLSRLASVHFAPTERACANLLGENISKDKIYLTGNTVIDALNCVTDEAMFQAKRQLTELGALARPLILVTSHRRENHGKRLFHILKAIQILAARFPNYNFIVPVHPNPNVHKTVYDNLSNIPNILLTEALSYPQLVYVMRHAILALSDSGGIQEEAPSCGLPLLVLRHETERVEGVQLGLAKLVGTNTATIVEEAEKLLMRNIRKKQKVFASPYGDGQARVRIVNIIKKYLNDSL